jgi:hypothetical protein
MTDQDHLAQIADMRRKKIVDLEAQLERWQEVAAFLAACLRDCGTIDSHAWHSRGTALESYARLKTTATPSDH